MRAFVFSGGGNRGALQVGAVKALLERDIVPEMIVGCSAGALNAAFLARDVSLEQVEHLAEVWRQTTKEDVYPGNRLSVLWRLVTGKESFYDNRNFYAFLQRSGTTPALTFAHLSHQVRLYITATHLATETLHVFGDDPSDRVLDALMASTALPPLHPPWEVNGEYYIDGGTVTPLPLRVAIERGATEIYALYIRDEHQERSAIRRSLAGIMDRSISTMLHLQAEHDLLLTEVAGKKVKLYELRLSLPNPPDINDWSQSDRMVARGYELATEYLAGLTAKPASRIQIHTPPVKRLVNSLYRGWRQMLSPQRTAVPVPVEASNPTPMDQAGSPR